MPQFDSIDTLAKWVVDQTIIVYLGGENRNDFFLLHLVTSAWSLRQLLGAGLEESSAKDMILHFLCAFLALYLVQKRPMVMPERIASPGTVSDITLTFSNPHYCTVFS
jgi:hypothetical protein